MLLSGARRERRRAQTPPRARTGIQSPVALAIAPPAAGPTTAPTAQAAFMNPNAMPCASRDCSAPSAISANAGVKSTPYAIAASTISGT